MRDNPLGDEAKQKIWSAVWRGEGDSKVAVETWLAGIHFRQDVGRGGPVIFALMGSAIVLDTLEAAARYVGPGKLPEA